MDNIKSGKILLGKEIQSLLKLKSSLENSFNPVK